VYEAKTAEDATRYIGGLARARGVTDREVRLAGGQSEGGTAEAPDDLESVVAR